MKTNAAGRCVQGNKNPNWKGGKIKKSCIICGREYFVRPGYIKSQYCSLQCVGISQRGKHGKQDLSKKIQKNCEICNKEFTVYKSSAHKWRCCSKSCHFKRRSILYSGPNSPGWKGGIYSLNPESYNRERARARSQKIPRNDEIIRFVPECIIKQKNRCAICKQKLIKFHIDHIIPISKGGMHDKSNIQILCVTCNLKKAAKLPETFMREMGFLC